MPPARRRRPLVALAVLLGVVAGLGVKAMTGPSATTPGHEDALAFNAWASYEFQFDTSAEMLATADLVVEGDVVDVGRGRILAGNSPMKQQLKEYRIAVTRRWKGPEAGPLVVEGAGWSISPVPEEGEIELRFADTVELAPGDHGIFYLIRSKRDRRLSFVNHQGIFLVEDGQVTDSVRTDAMVAAMERLSAVGLRQQLQRDLRLVKTGAVTGRRSSR